MNSVQSLDEVNDRGRPALQQAFHEKLAMDIHHGSGNSGLMNIHVDILFLTHEGAPFSRFVMPTITTYRKSGRLFMLRVMGFQELAA